MSRKHFQALADCLRQAKVQNMLDEEQWVYMIGSIANVCADHNPLFDRQRFYSACRVDCKGCESCGYGSRVEGMRFCKVCLPKVKELAECEYNLEA